MTHDPQEAVEFGRFQLLPRRRELRADGVAVALGSRAFDVLVILTEARGALVTKEEILSRVWPGLVVEENNLVVQISTLRKALGKDRNFIRTESGRGYRFVADVRTSVITTPDEAPDDLTGTAEAVQSGNLLVPEANPIGQLNKLETLAGDIVDLTKSGDPQWRTRRRFTLVLFASVLVLLITATLFWLYYPRALTSPKIASIAVLPLENLSGDPSQDYFADGMTDELITDLAQISTLRVISRTSIMTYKQVRKLLPDIARELNVDAVVEGTVSRSGERIRLTVQLIEVPAERHIWAQIFERDLRDTLPLQANVAHAIADRIHAAMNQPEQVAMAVSKPVDPDAYEAYLKGRFFWNKRTEEGLRKAIEYFNLATEKDPNYARAYSGLADAYALSGDWEYGILSPQDAFSKAKAAATKALSLDYNLAEAHTSLAFILDLYAWDWANAETEYERAISLYPGYATAHHWHAWHLIVTGRIGDGIEELRKAETLDPLSLIIGADLADALCIARRYDDSLAQSRKTLEMDPNFAVAHYELGQALNQKNLYDSAIAEFKRAIELSGSNDIFLANLARAYAAQGRKDDAVKIITDLMERQRQSTSVESNIALIYVALGDDDEAMVWLEKAYHERFNPSILVRPAFDPLRSDVRFQDLLRRIGLPAVPPQSDKPPI